ncbi:putative sulfite reductase [Dioszegia hungarica]|uniref:assimilatory sulfite reductase (NADPH) n=1 Tax=Dioszegia hungarica TaxID=4972 RepID=A0AA38HF86_9TREE|nr:putative sulfite reductase [Dioszegia hungarica]KAI9638842.1 putative sulfite reductase [Dioszegia hungarica]
MAPTVLATEITSGSFQTAGKSQIAAVNKNNGVSLDGSSTPYSATSTAVSDYGDNSKASPTATAESLVDANLPSARLSPTDSQFYVNLLASSAPGPASKAGSTVYGSAIEVIEALAVQESAAVWVYDDAVQVGFGAKAVGWGSDKVYPVQNRSGAGMELAGYSAKSQGKLSVFASTTTLPNLVSSLGSIKGDNVVIHLATTAPADSLVLADTLFAAGVLKSLTNLPEGWEVVFSSGAEAVSNAAKIYGAGGKYIHVVESTYSGREVTSYTFPSTSSAEIGFSSRNVEGKDVTVAPAGLYAQTASGGVITLHSLSPAPDALAAALAGKSVSVVGGTKADADALKAVVLSALYSASSSSSQVLPSVKSVVVDAAVPSTQGVADSKTISFFTSPTSPLPALLSHLFLSSPSLQARLAAFGSASSRGVKSILALSPSGTKPAPLTPATKAQVAWVSDANVLKSTDVLSTLVPGGILILELPWQEEEVAVKLSRTEIQTIQKNNIRVFLLDLDPASPTLPIKEAAAFLLLYTGKQVLPQGVRKVLDAFYNGEVGREDIEEAQAGLGELVASEWAVPELEEGKKEKVKAEWEWDALPGQEGVIDLHTDEAPQLLSKELAARHLLFREAFAVPETKSLDLDADVNGPTPVISTLRPSTHDETFLVTVTENRRLTPQTYDRNVFHLELDSAGTGLKYEIGEAIGIHGWNDGPEVLSFCEWYGLDPDALVTFPNPLKAGTMETRTIFQLLQQNVDLFGRPGKAYYAALAKLATKKSDAMTLKFISAPEGAELFKKMAEKETVTFADVLYRFRTARPGIEGLVGLIPEIKPRHYSIASSQKAVGDKVELLIVTVDWLSSTGSPRYGQCTRYLAALAPGAQVTVSIKPSVMKLPPSDKQPIIMAGLGTGAAPFRAFMQHRAWQRTQGIDVGPLLYYFGSRYRSQEYLYGEEIEAYIASGVIAHAGLAFSRDGKDKVYIQHKMMQDKKLLADLMSGKGDEAAYFYLCGPTWPVPDVYEALVGSLVEEKGMERKRAEEFIEELKEEERYVLEVY